MSRPLTRSSFHKFLSSRIPAPIPHINHNLPPFHCKAVLSSHYSRKYLSHATANSKHYSTSTDIYAQFRQKNLRVYATEPFTAKDSKFQAHALRDVKSKRDIMSFLAILYSDKRIAKGNHNMVAYRVKEDKSDTEGSTQEQTEGEPVEAAQESPVPQIHSFKNDDGEKGAGDILLSLLSQRNETNACIVVTRWTGRTPLGPLRFRVIRQMGVQALEMAEGS